MARETFYRHRAVAAGMRAWLAAAILLVFHSMSFGQIPPASHYPGDVDPDWKPGQPVHTGDLFTLSLRVRAASAGTRVEATGTGSGQQVLLAYGADNTATYFDLRLDPRTGRLSFYAPALKGKITSGITVADDRWHQLAVTYGLDQMKFYKDGLLVSAAKVTGCIKDTAATLTIAGTPDHQSGFSGSVDQIKLFRSVLNADKIRDLYMEKQANWDLNEGMGIYVYEPYNYAGHGSLTGAVWTADPKFGQTPEFKATGAGMAIPAARIDLSDRFTLAFWMKAPARREESRIVFSRGTIVQAPSYFAVRLDRGTGALRFIAPGLNGNTGSSIPVDDNAWHHIAINYVQGRLQFFIDGRLARTNKSTGKIVPAADSIFVNPPGGANPFSGRIARLKIFGTDLSPDQVRDLYHEIEIAWWKFDEGKGGVAHDNKGGNDAVLTGAEWIPGRGSSFSEVLHFNDKGARVVTRAASLDLGNCFTIAAWVQAPGNTKGARVIAARGKPGEPGNFCLGLDPATGSLSFSADGLSGDLNGGFRIDDNVWHHVMITYGNGEMRFYKDRQLVRTGKVKGAVVKRTAPLSIGAFADGSMSFGGNMAEVKIYPSIKTTDEVTPVVPPAGPLLNLRRGIVFDRIQGGNFPGKPEWDITPNDVAVAKALGFDHIKILLTADEYVADSGLRMEHMYYAEHLINTALTSGLPVLVTIHPELKFKYTYLGSDSGFRKMLGFYRALSKYLASKWTPQQIAFQLMTEPFSNGPGGAEFTDWNIIYPQMAAAARTFMPGYTLVIPGDKTGNIRGMTALVPLHDENVYYSFTTYEPYQFGFNAMYRPGEYWKDISYVPWPASPEIIAARMPAMMAEVKPADSLKAVHDLIAYGAGHYNRLWLDNRAKEVRDWDDAYGGDLHVMVVEFGGLDPIVAAASGASHGVDPAERVAFIRDQRASFESVGMGWDYWSFNEYFTLFDPVARKKYGAVDTTLADHKLLEALGVK